MRYSVRQVAGSGWDGTLTNGGGQSCQWVNSHTCDTTSDGLQLNAFLTLVTTEGTACFLAIARLLPASRQ